MKAEFLTGIRLKVGEVSRIHAFHSAPFTLSKWDRPGLCPFGDH